MRSSKQKGTNAMITSAEFGIFLILFPITGITLWLAYQLWLKRNENLELKQQVVEVKDQIDNLDSDTLAANATKRRKEIAEAAEAKAEAAKVEAANAEAAKTEAARVAKAKATEAKDAEAKAEAAKAHALKHPLDNSICRFPEGGCGKSWLPLGWSRMQ